jgi:hypothetical protein
MAKTPNNKRLLRSQENYLKKPEFSSSLVILASYPFSDTATLLEHCNNSKLTKQRLLLNLNKAAEWGWVGWVDRYAGSSELNPILTGGADNLLYYPAKPLGEAAYRTILESQRDEPVCHRVTKQYRHWYLTPRGAAVVSYLGRIRGGIDFGNLEQLNLWHEHFVKRIGITKENLVPCLKRLSGLTSTRQLLWQLSRVTSELYWQDFGEVKWRGNLGEGSVRFDATAFLGNRVNFENVLKGKNPQNSVRILMLVADTERLTPVWIKNYLTSWAKLLRAETVAFCPLPRPHLSAATRVEKQLDLLSQARFYNLDSSDTLNGSEAYYNAEYEPNLSEKLVRAADLNNSNYALTG